MHKNLVDQQTTGTFRQYNTILLRGLPTTDDQPTNDIATACVAICANVSSTWIQVIGLPLVLK